MSLGEYNGAGSGTTKLLLHLNGNSTDSSGNGNNGTDTAITYSQANGKFGQGAGFSPNGYITIPVDFPTTGFAFEVRRDINQVAVFIAGWNENNSVTIDVNTWYLYTIVSVASGHTFLYLNGKQISDFNVNLGVSRTFSVWAKTSTTTSTERERIFDRLSASDFRIGYTGFSGQAWNGAMDEVIIENRAWSATEVAKYYSMTKGRFGII